VPVWLKKEIHLELKPKSDEKIIFFFRHDKTGRFSCRGLKICAEYFKKRGHKVTIFLPQFRRRHPLTLNPEILDQLEKEGIVVFTPSRKVNGKMVVSYDDR
jgi:ribonuclease ZC3H12